MLTSELNRVCTRRGSADLVRTLVLQGADPFLESWQTHRDFVLYAALGICIREPEFLAPLLSAITELRQENSVHEKFLPFVYYAAKCGAFESLCALLSTLDALLGHRFLLIDEAQLSATQESGRSRLCSWLLSCRSDSPSRRFTALNRICAANHTLQSAALHDQLMKGLPYVAWDHADVEPLAALLRAPFSARTAAHFHPAFRERAFTLACCFARCNVPLCLVEPVASLFVSRRDHP